MAATIAVSSLSAPTPATNERSILMTSSGKRFRRASDE
jgi:hypothetical protein